VNWINNLVRPRFGGILSKRETPENLWVKDPQSGAMVFHKDLEENQYVVPDSGYHMKISVRDRFRFFFDGGVYKELPTPQVPADPLGFRDHKRYVDRIRENRTKTAREDSIIAAEGEIEGIPVVAAAHEFGFMGGSLGTAAGEAIVQGMERAVELKRPFIMFCASGGARMQEGILSLMQLPRSTVGVQRLRDAGLPYIVVMTNPTTGGVSASYAMLGDIHIAEPGAEIGFAGKRVIEQTIREKLPDGFQTAEYLERNGMVDMVVSRLDMSATIARILRLMLGMPEKIEALLEAPQDDEAPGVIARDGEVVELDVEAPKA
jgi:acetyl-CoA carboxylase carboxyl transferase subunit beta